MAIEWEKQRLRSAGIQTWFMHSHQSNDGLVFRRNAWVSSRKGIDDQDDGDFVVTVVRGRKA